MRGVIRDFIFADVTALSTDSPTQVTTLALLLTRRRLRYASASLRHGKL